MGYKRLFILVEGEDDIRFFDRIIKPIHQKKYDLVEVIRFARMKEDKRDDFLKSIQAMNADYIYATDIDDAPCVTAKKQEIQNRLRNLDTNRTIVILKEIESWYLAGLSNEDLQKFKIRSFGATEDINKEQFNSLIPKKFSSRIDFMLEILKSFSNEIAKQKNGSFRYFIEKYCCEVS
ncbi:MAG: hypothetical protein IB616_00940 [Methanosarcinales archaeon]|nr:MAG: hypothetical protein IB616_00940 [Methanosarcinales archaeon]